MAYEPRNAKPTLGDPVHRDPVTGEPVRREARTVRPVHEERSSGGIGKWLALLAVAAVGAWLLSGLFNTADEVEVATNTRAPAVVNEQPATEAAPIVVEQEVEAAPATEAAPVVTEEPAAADSNVETTTVPITRDE